MPDLWCPRCETWTRGPCFVCAELGTDEPRTRPARSWNGDDASQWPEPIPEDRVEESA